MNVGPLGGVLAGAAGSQLAQTKGSDVERAAQDTGQQQRTDKLAQQADAAAGVGQTEEDQGTEERDADGRRMWEGPPDGSGQEQPGDEHQQQRKRQAKDPTGTAGNSLDLTG